MKTASSRQVTASELRNIFSKNPDCPISRRASAVGFGECLIVNVELVSTKNNLGRALDSLPENHSLVDLRMAAMISELLEHSDTIDDRAQLIYADLSLIDLSIQADVVEYIWCIGHRLFDKPNWKDLLGLYANYIDTHGTSLMSQDYIFFRNPEEDPIEGVPVKISNPCILNPYRYSFQPKAGKLGNAEKYLHQIVLSTSQEESETKSQYAVLHYIAGVDDQHLALQKESCAAHLFLIFKIKGFLPAGSKFTIDNEISLNLRLQLGRLAGLLLLEKAKTLREEIRRNMEEQKAEQELLKKDTQNLLDKLREVESEARTLRSRFDSPLDHFRWWLLDALPIIFHTTPKYLKREFSLLPCDITLTSAHNKFDWKRDHLAASLWLLCMPESPKWIVKESLADSLGMVNSWRMVMEYSSSCNYRELSWNSCCSLYKELDTLPDEKFKKILEFLKGLQRLQKEDRRDKSFRIDQSGHLLKFLLGEEITGSRFNADNPVSVPDTYSMCVCHGLPALKSVFEKTHIESSCNASGVSIEIRTTDATKSLELLNSVSKRLKDMVSRVQFDSSLTWDKSSLLAEFAGKGDARNAILKFLLPDLREAPKILETTDSRGSVTSISIDHSDKQLSNILWETSGSLKINLHFT